jgi:hypothetical protein
MEGPAQLSGGALLAPGGPTSLVDLGAMPGILHRVPEGLRGDGIMIDPAR